MTATIYLYFTWFINAAVSTGALSSEDPEIWNQAAGIDTRLLSSISAFERIIKVYNESGITPVSWALNISI